MGGGMVSEQHQTPKVQAGLHTPIMNKNQRVVQRRALHGHWRQQVLQSLQPCTGIVCGTFTRLSTATPKRQQRKVQEKGKMAGNCGAARTQQRGQRRAVKPEGTIHTHTGRQTNKDLTTYV